MRVYRIKNAVRAVLIGESSNRLTELPAGAVLSLANIEPDSNGMIEGTSDERSVLVFLNDLGERAELMNIKIPSASVRVAPEMSER
jgi:hypothetical protein